MLAWPCYTESIFLPSSECSTSRSPFISYLCKAGLGNDLGLYHRHCSLCVTAPSPFNRRELGQPLRSVVDGSRSDPSGSKDDESGTRLVRAIRAFQIRLSSRIKQLRKGLLMKILFFLVGFYCATAFATVIGQTGDWDILSAGLAVAVVEGIGALMYKASFKLLDKLNSFITIFNYWKAGLCLGLFLDAFKYEIYLIIESCNPFNIELDVFPVVL